MYVEYSFIPNESQLCAQLDSDVTRSTIKLDGPLEEKEYLVLTSKNRRVKGTVRASFSPSTCTVNLNTLIYLTGRKTDDENVIINQWKGRGNSWFVIKIGIQENLVL